MPKEIVLYTTPEVGLQKEACLEFCKKHAADRSFILKKRSIDARGNTVKIRLSIDVFAKDEIPKYIQYQKPSKQVGHAPSVLIVGAGPAGLFAALELLSLGIKPIILERGKTVRERRRDLALLNKNHIVHPDSNYCFGEGGAGTYSDGKLYTRSDKRGNVRKVLEWLYLHGAPEDILIDAHPHVGTNRLPKVIEEIRSTILQAGGEIYFGKKVEDFIIQNSECKGVITADGKSWLAGAVLLATGHSARDIFIKLHSLNVLLQAKPFALGVRVEHPQMFINQKQYHCTADTMRMLPSAAYSLVTQVRYGSIQKGVFSFCMCPGGIIAPAATAPGEVVVNGWSPSGRNNYFANSGIVVSMDETDWKAYQEHGPLAGLFFQRAIEQKACAAAGGTQTAPAQMLKDFMQKKTSTSINKTSYIPGVVPIAMDEVLPAVVTHALRQGFRDFNAKINGFIHPEAHVLAVESRTSSPVRIPRDPETLEHVQIKHLYPCGEGAGYAGGIVSAAMDGIRCAQKIAQRILRTSPR